MCSKIIHLPFSASKCKRVLINTGCVSSCSEESKKHLVYLYALVYF